MLQPTIESGRTQVSDRARALWGAARRALLLGAIACSASACLSGGSGGKDRGTDDAGEAPGDDDDGRDPNDPDGGEPADDSADDDSADDSADDDSADDDSADDDSADDGASDDSADDSDDDGASDDGAGDDGLLPPPNTGESWTLLVYFVADNDLEPFAVQDLNEMMGVGSNDDLTILAQVDRAEGYSEEALEGIGDWTGTKRVRVEDGSLTELDDLGEVNMGEAETLSEFVQWGLEVAPSDRTALIFWDHGGGWNGFGGDASHALDDLSLVEIRAGLGGAIDAVGRDTKLDLVGFDACLMATYETASALQPFAEYLLASQELEPGNGWDWASLSLLANEPETDVAGLGARIADDYAEHEQTDPTITLSLTHLGRLPALGEALAGLAAELVDADPGLVGRVRAEASEFAQGTHLVDLVSFATELAAADGALSDASQAVADAMEDVLVYRVAGAHRPHANGLSLYFPMTRAVAAPGYQDVPGLEAWRSYLDAFFGEGAELEAVARFVNPDNVGDLSFDGESGVLLLQGELASGVADGLVSATTTFGVVSEGILLVLGDSTAFWDAQFAVGGWGASVLALQQGDLQTLVYYSQSSELDGTSVFTIPFMLDGERLVLYQLVLSEASELLSEEYYQQVGDAWGAVAIEPGALLAPVLSYVDPETGAIEPFVSEDLVDPNAGFDLSFEALDPGTQIFMWLEITDYAGNVDFVYNLGTL